MLCAMSPVFAYDCQVDGVYYNLNKKNNTATVTHCDGFKYKGDVVIPKAINDDGVSYAVTTIGLNAFSDCTELASVTIPTSVTYINYAAFKGCTGLASIAIPNSVASIGSSAFEDCTALTSVTIPKSVTSSIGSAAFGGCTELASIVVEEGNTTFDSRDNCNAIISTSENVLLDGCKSTIIPDAITAIGFYAFKNHTGLTSITIPGSVSSLGRGAFMGCAGLTKLVSLAVEPPSCLDSAFDGVDKNTCKLFVPKESVEAYKAAEQWKEFVLISEFDGVDDVSTDTLDAVYEVYNLQGVRVGSGMHESDVSADALPHGVYIIVSPQGGKKLKI